MLARRRAAKRSCGAKNDTLPYCCSRWPEARVHGGRWLGAMRSGRPALAAALARHGVERAMAERILGAERRRSDVSARSSRRLDAESRSRTRALDRRAELASIWRSKTELAVEGGEIGEALDACDPHRASASRRSTERAGANAGPAGARPSSSTRGPARAAEGACKERPSPRRRAGVRSPT